MSAKWVGNRHHTVFSISPMTQIVPNPFTACIRVVHVSNKHQYPFWICKMTIDTMAFLKWVKKRSCGRFQGWLVVSNLLKHALLQYILLLFNDLYLWWFDSASYLLIWDDDLTIVLGWIQTGFKAPARYIPIFGLSLDLSWVISIHIKIIPILLDVLLQGSRLHLYLLRPDRAKCQGQRGDRTRNPLVNN